MVRARLVFFVSLFFLSSGLFCSDKGGPKKVVVKGGKTKANSGAGCTVASAAPVVEDSVLGSVRTVKIPSFNAWKATATSQKDDAGFDMSTVVIPDKPGLAKNFGIQTCVFQGLVAKANSRGLSQEDASDLRRAIVEANAYHDTHPNDFSSEGLAILVTAAKNGGLDVGRNYLATAYQIMNADNKRYQAALAKSFNSGAKAVLRLKGAMVACQECVESQGGSGRQSPLSHYGDLDTDDGLLRLFAKIQHTAKGSKGKKVVASAVDTTEAGAGFGSSERSKK